MIRTSYILTATFLNANNRSDKIFIAETLCLCRCWLQRPSDNLKHPYCIYKEIKRKQPLYWTSEWKHKEKWLMSLNYTLQQAWLLFLAGKQVAVQALTLQQLPGVRCVLTTLLTHPPGTNRAGGTSRSHR